MVQASEILDIIEIVYYAPALILSLFVVKKHGFSREAGWILLSTLSLLRLIGASTGIAAVYSPSSGLIEASLICGSIGSAALVAAFTGIVNRVYAGTGIQLFPPRLVRLLQLLGLAAVILGILGGINLANSDPDKQKNGETYLKIAVILILVQFLASTLLAALSTLHISRVMEGDKRLLFIALAAVPFILVRVIYSMLTAFNEESKDFSMMSNSNTAVILRAILGYAMEFVVVALFLFGGFTAPKQVKPVEANERSQYQQYELRQEPQQQKYQTTV